jgi:hypothetical protein
MVPKITTALVNIRIARDMPRSAKIIGEPRDTISVLRCVSSGERARHKRVHALAQKSDAG